MRRSNGDKTEPASTLVATRISSALKYGGGLVLLSGATDISSTVRGAGKYLALQGWACRLPHGAVSSARACERNGGVLSQVSTMNLGNRCCQGDTMNTGGLDRGNNNSKERKTAAAPTRCGPVPVPVYTGTGTNA